MWLWILDYLSVSSSFHTSNSHSHRTWAHKLSADHLCVCLCRKMHALRWLHFLAPFYMHAKVQALEEKENMKVQI